MLQVSFFYHGCLVSTLIAVGQKHLEPPCCAFVRGWLESLVLYLMINSNAPDYERASRLVEPVVGNLNQKGGKT